MYNDFYVKIGIRYGGLSSEKEFLIWRMMNAQINMIKVVGLK